MHGSKGKEGTSMKKWKWSTILGILVSFVALAILAQLALAKEEVPRMTKEELKALLGNPDLIILDVRFGRSWDNSQWKIKGAIREDPQAEIAAWADKYPKDKTLVLY